MVIGVGKITEIRKMADSRYNEAQIASQFNIEKETVKRYLRLSNQKYVPKILLFDIETLPMEVLVWGLYKQKIPYENILKEWCIVSWAAKWLFGTDIMSGVISPKAAKERNDGQIIGRIWSLINTADIIIAHNAKKFDVRKLNARFILHKLKPPMPYQVIDTLKESQKHMGFSSHRLDYLTRILTHTRKIKTEYGLWKKCAGIEATPDMQETALKEMVRYNKQDVITLEDLYVELRPWIKSHPNLGLYYADAENSHCPNCGSIDLKREGDKTYKTTVGRFRVFRCNECGAICRSRFSDLSKEERKELVAPVAR